MTYSMGLGSLAIERFQIDLTVTIVVQKRRPIPLGLRDKVEEGLKELLENDIIEGP